MHHAVPHGFRSTFVDRAAERTNYPPELREMALAHALGDKTQAKYQRGDLFERRRALMADWAAYIESPPATGNVVEIKGSTAFSVEPSKRISALPAPRDERADV